MISSSDSMTILPNSLSFDSIGSSDFSLPILDALFPVSLINFSIRPLHNTETMLFVFEVVACVNSSVGPLENAFAMHLVIFPLTFVLFSIRPDHFAPTLDFVFVEFALVLGHVRPYELSYTMLESIMMLATK